MMRHVNEAQIKNNAIYMYGEDFADLVYELLGIELIVDEYGIDRADDFVDDFMMDIMNVLSKYYDAKITSIITAINTDNGDEEVGVWLVCGD